MKKKMITIVQVMAYMIAVLFTIGVALLICSVLMRVCPV